MLELAGRTVLLGGFHDHWSRADGGNPSLLLAALNYYHYDFICLMDGNSADADVQRAAAAWSNHLKIYLGREEFYGWGHLVTLTPRAPQLPQDDPDWERVLKKTKANYDLLILAHPPHHRTWKEIFLAGKMDRLIDEGFIDGVQMHPDSPELVDWFGKRDQAGKLTPIVSGWDLHLVKSLEHLPPVLYTAQRPPNGHYEAPCTTRTLVFAEQNELADICHAVRQGRTVVEDLQTGRLVGPASLVHFLECNGYREAVTALDTARDAVQLQTSTVWTGGKTAEFKIAAGRAGTLCWPVNLYQTQKSATMADEKEIRCTVPLTLDRDEYYLPVAWRDDKGFERIWAVQVQHPIQYDIMSWLRQDETAIEFIPSFPLNGDLQLDLQDGSGSIQQRVTGRTLLPLPPGRMSSAPIHYNARVRLDDATQRSVSGYLTYIPVERFAGDWNSIPVIGVDQPRNDAVGAYGHSRPWPGPEVFSARLQFAWDAQALWMRADVRDEIHHQKGSGNSAYEGDCLQLAIDPVMVRQGTVGYFYCYNLSLNDHGPELYRAFTFSKDMGNPFSPLPVGQILEKRLLNVTPIEKGLRYELQLPWTQLVPAEPAVGVRLGVYYIMFNNDGEGLLDTLHWPVPARGMWMKPRQWGVLTLMD